MTLFDTTPCNLCGAKLNEEGTDANGHFLINDRTCPVGAGRLIVERILPPLDPDGWQRPPRDLRDEALEDLRKQNGKLRQAVEQKDAEIAQWTARIKELEERHLRVVADLGGEMIWLVEDGITETILEWQSVPDSQPHEVAAKFACEARSFLRAGKVDLAQRKMQAAQNVVNGFVDE